MVGVVVLAATVVAVVGGPERTEPLAFGVTTPGGATAAAELDAVEAAVAQRPEQPPAGDAERGRGLLLARAAVDRFSYERDGGTNRWVLVLGDP